MPTIDLGRLTGNGRVHNLSGKTKGQDARRDLGIEGLDKEIEPIIVVIPDEIYAISPSFFLGLFSQSLSHFGSRDAFMRHYLFKADSVIIGQIEDGIQQHFITPTALG